MNLLKEYRHIAKGIKDIMSDKDSGDVTIKVEHQVEAGPINDRFSELDYTPPLKTLPPGLALKELEKAEPEPVLDSTCNPALELSALHPVLDFHHDSEPEVTPFDPGDVLGIINEPFIVDVWPHDKPDPSVCPLCPGNFELADSGWSLDDAMSDMIGETHVSDDGLEEVGVYTDSSTPFDFDGYEYVPPPAFAGDLEYVPTDLEEKVHTFHVDDDIPIEFEGVQVMHEHVQNALKDIASSIPGHEEGFIIKQKMFPGGETINHPIKYKTKITSEKTMNLILSPKDNMNKIVLENVETFALEGNTLVVIFNDGTFRNYPLQHLWWYGGALVNNGGPRTKPLHNVTE